MSRYVTLIFLSMILLARPSYPQEASPGCATLEKLPLLPGFFSTHQFSSHNKTGHNGDSRWHLYEDERGDKVIFDVIGPGCVRSMWGTDIREGAAFNFYLDGEEAPRFTIPMLDFYQGKHGFFPPPLVSYERRGEWGEKPFAGNSFVPIPFAKGLKITVSGHLEFYHILFDRYPHGTKTSTFLGGEDHGYLLRAFERMGEEPYAINDAEEIRVEKDELPAGEALTLADLEKAGCIRRLVIEGPAIDDFIREAEIEMHWDDHTFLDVRAPLGFFFGSAVRAADMRTLAMRVERLPESRVRLTTWFPMPFWKRGRVVLVNRSSRGFGNIRAEVGVAPSLEPRDRAGYFTACFRKGTTTYGRDWLFFESPGWGWFVGAVQSMMKGHYCEGDERFYMDGAISPQINGTGSEDYYLGCFWPNREFNSPFANCVGEIQKEGGGTFNGSYTVPSCYSRFHLEAPIPFHARMDARIQHGGVSHLASEYASLAFCYLRRRPVLHQTDFLNVGHAVQEGAHDYKAASSEPTGKITARPEGSYWQSRIQEEGRRHGASEITFVVAVDPSNQGVRLRRRLDQASPRQTAEVYIDDLEVGVWYHPDHNEHLRWFDSDFDIHPRFTAGKEKLNVRLKVLAGDGRGEFTDFKYWVYSFVP